MTDPARPLHDVLDLEIADYADPFDLLREHARYMAFRRACRCLVNEDISEEHAYALAAEALVKAAPLERFALMLLVVGFWWHWESRDIPKPESVICL